MLPSRRQCSWRKLCTERSLNGEISEKMLKRWRDSVATFNGGRKAASGGRMFADSVKSGNLIKKSSHLSAEDLVSRELRLVSG
jgi:hypothetical protein